MVRYWVQVQPRCDWESQNEATCWSEVSGGAGGASTPGPGDVAVFDASSGDADCHVMISQAVTVGSIDCTGYVGEFRMASNVTLTVETLFRLDAAMAWTSDDPFALVIPEPGCVIEDFGQPVQYG